MRVERTEQRAVLQKNIDNYGPFNKFKIKILPLNYH